MSFASRRQETAAEGPPASGAIITGLAAIAFGLGGFGAWAALATLSSAAVAPGVIEVDSHRKSVQHRDGGIIAELLVREGDHVAAGQVLLRLDDLESRAAFAVLEQQHHALLAQETRLIAERDQTELRWPATLERRKARAEVARILRGQEHIWRSRRETLAGQVEMTNRRIGQYRAQISALEAQLGAGERQRELIAQELANVRELVGKGLERKPRLLALAREAARLDGAHGDYRGRIAQMGEAIAEAELQILELRAARLEEVADELQDVAARRAEVEENLAAAEIQLGRREVLAPEAGRVLDLRYVTPGGVIPPGGTILDLLPDDDRLVISARVQPLDIESVHAGMAAQVVLTGLKGRTTPRLEGVVARVSPDALTDERTGVRYFLARIEVDREQLGRLEGVALSPGMPAEVLIVNGERSALDYLIQPVRDSFRRAWREQ